MEYRKKPVVVEAFRYDGDMIRSNRDPYAPAWALKALEDGTMYYKDAGELYIKTLEGDHHVSVGDYIIKGVAGELYPCKPDIFEQTYEGNGYAGLVGIPGPCGVPAECSQRGPINAARKINILGTEYTITVKKYDEDGAFERRSIDGYCDNWTHQIVVCDMTTYKDWEHEPRETIAETQKEALRHEIVRAFLSESGLGDSALSPDCAWAKNEEMVDWFALQGPKIFKAWQEAGAV